LVLATVTLLLLLLLLLLMATLAMLVTLAMPVQLMQRWATEEAGRPSPLAPTAFHPHPPRRTPPGQDHRRTKALLSKEGSDSDPHHRKRSCPC
jgi:hypothetical protein